MGVLTGSIQFEEREFSKCFKVIVPDDITYQELRNVFTNLGIQMVVSLKQQEGFDWRTQRGIEGYGV